MAKFKVGDKVLFKNLLKPSRGEEKGTVTGYTSDGKVEIRDDDGIHVKASEPLVRLANSRAAKNDADPYLSEKLKLMIRQGAVSEAAGGKPMPGDVVFEYRGKRYYTDKDSAHMVKQFSDAGLVKMHNSRAANAKFKVGDRVKAKNPAWVGYQGHALGTDVYTVKKVDWDGTVKLDGFLDLWISPDSLVAANSRARNAYITGATVAYQGSAWKVVAVHSVGKGGYSADTYDLKSNETGVVVRDVPEWDIWPKNTLPFKTNSAANSRAANCGVRSTIPAVNAALGAEANATTANALPKVGDRVRMAYGGGKEIGKVESVDVDRGIWSVRFPSGVAHTGPHLLEVVKARY